MGMKIEEAIDFFMQTLKKLGFCELELSLDSSSEGVVRAKREDGTVTIRFRQLQSGFIHIPRTEVLIEAPEHVHDAIRQHIMRSKAGG